MEQERSDALRQKFLMTEQMTEISRLFKTLQNDFASPDETISIDDLKARFQSFESNIKEVLGQHFEVPWLRDVLLAFRQNCAERVLHEEAKKPKRGFLGMFATKLDPEEQLIKQMRQLSVDPEIYGDNRDSVIFVDEDFIRRTSTASFSF